MKYPIGSRVKVSAAIDETADKRFIGKTGIITRLNGNNQTCNPPHHPLHEVTFEPGQWPKGEKEPRTLKETFWHEELTLITSTT